MDWPYSISFPRGMFCCRQNPTLERARFHDQQHRSAFPRIWPQHGNSKHSLHPSAPSQDANGMDLFHAPNVFLHGLSTCRIEFSQVTPFHSNDYDLILVDQLGHSESTQTLPFTLDNAVNVLSHLISTKITGRKAHIVGQSVGGVAALEFARRSPELILSLFCTDCA